MANLVDALFGAITKTVDGSGRAIWTTPCSPNDEVAGFPRGADEGFICYLLRIIPFFQGPPGPTGPQGPAGPAGSSAATLATSIKVADYTLSNTDGAIIANPAAPIILSLPSIAGVDPGKFYYIWTNGAFNVTVAANGADVIKSPLNIPGAANYILSNPGEAITLLSTAGVWYVV